jgi:ribosomal protein S12 methylthiotransferase accessory factor YcaO
MLAPFQPLSGQGGEVRYSWARQVRDGTQTLVPASFVFLPYLYEPDEPRRDVQTSSGLAAGRSLEEAVERGLLELIERDAVRRAWNGKTPIVGISSSAIDIEGLQLTLVKTSYPVHVVVAVIDRPDLPAPAVGFAARREISDAALAAALEAVAVGELTMSRNGPEETERPGKRFPRGSLDLAFTPDKWVVAEPVLADGFQPFEHRDLLESVPGACFVDLTTTDVATLGASVARVLAPNLLSLPATGSG